MTVQKMQKFAVGRCSARFQPTRGRLWRTHGESYQGREREGGGIPLFSGKECANG